MTNYSETITLDLALEDVQSICGAHSIFIRELEKKHQVVIFDRGQRFRIEGEKAQVIAAKNNLSIKAEEVCPSRATQKTQNIMGKTFKIVAKSENQQATINSLAHTPVNFIIGPAGTGKTLLAVATALRMLYDHRVERIVITRPIVEAGEKLGFLPGDIAQKVDPYLKPIYDILYQLIGTVAANKLIESNTIEITPLAYMRGRTFNQTFIIADECQNTLPSQMKMLLTRLGHSSHMAITGDLGQIDLARNQESGLSDAVKTLSGIDNIHFNYLYAHDSVRHPLVEAIVKAYEKTNP